jgi:hypothetical protein
MESTAHDFAVNALKSSRTDSTGFHLYLGHLALNLGLPEEALNQYKQAEAAHTPSSMFGQLDIIGAIDHLYGLHPNLMEPVIITEKVALHPTRSIIWRVFENTAVRILSIFTAGFSMSFFV